MALLSTDLHGPLVSNGPCRSVDKSAIQFSNSSNILKFTFSINFSNFHAIYFNFLIFLIIENFSF